MVSQHNWLLESTPYLSVSKFPKAPCSVIVDTWALKRLPYHHFGVYVYTIELHGAFGKAGTMLGIVYAIPRSEQK